MQESSLSLLLGVVSTPPQRSLHTKSWLITGRGEIALPICSQQRENSGQRSKRLDEVHPDVTQQSIHQVALRERWTRRSVG
jgi:hypothetical protein